MIKKTLFFVAGGALVLALLFGGRLVPYAKTTINKIREQAKSAVPVSVQIDSARDQLENVDAEVKEMMMNVAREEVDIRNVRNRLEKNQSELDRQYSHIMRLKSHVDSGEVYTARGRVYSNERLRDELTSLFKVFKTSEKTVADLQKTLSIREQGLEAAKQQLEETIAQRHELAVEIENLTARKQMVDVAKTASKLNLDQSELSEAREMIQEISTRIEVEAQFLELTPQFISTIPTEDINDGSGDIVQDIDDYFHGRQTEDVATK